MKSSKVILIGIHGENLGIMPLDVAEAAARGMEGRLQLVPSKDICKTQVFKIVDFISRDPEDDESGGVPHKNPRPSPSPRFDAVAKKIHNDSTGS